MLQQFVNFRNQICHFNSFKYKYLLKEKKNPKTVDEYECVCMCMIWILSAFAILIHSVVYVRNNKIKNKDICQQMLHSTFAYIYAKGKLILILKNIQFNIHNIFCTKLTAASFKKFAQCL